MDLLEDRDTYWPLTSHSRDKHKIKLISMFRTIRVEGGLGDTTCKILYPNCTGPLQNSIGYPKYTKDTLLKPIMSSRVAVTYGVAKDVYNITRPLVGHSHTALETPRTLWTRSKPSDKGKGNVLHLMMWRPTHQLQWNLPYPSSRTHWNRTYNFNLRHPC